MSHTFRQMIVPIYLFLCLIFGGSQQSVWGLLGLQILAILIIAYACVAPAADGASKGRGLLVLLVAVLALTAAQLIPLPPVLWTQLPGRSVIEDGYRALDQQLPWLPVSLTPHATLYTFAALLPPVAVILAVLRLKAYRESWVAVALLAGTLTAILLGYVQVSTGGSGDAAWYLYEITNVGSAVGFFANRNHMGTLLLMTLPFVIALSFGGKEAIDRRGTPLAIIGVAGVMAILLGIAVNGSLAAVALAVPVIAAGALLFPTLRRFRGLLVSTVAVALIGAMIFLTNSPVQPKVTGETTSSIEGRWQIWERTWSAIESSFPMGTGLGSFEKVYATVEPPREVTLTYVNHAHNDYLQLLLTGGIPAVVLAIAFLVWWVAKARAALAPPVANRFAGAAAIASAAALAHSVVDYPLRTTAIAATFAICLALLAVRRSAQGEGSSRDSVNVRPVRHLKLG